MKYIFDVDGTLTPSRGIIDAEFKAWFNSFCLSNDVYLVTGSDKAKTVEQIGEETYNLCKRVYQCSGSDVYEGDKQVHCSDWEAPASLKTILDGWLIGSKFPLRTGNHLEERPGMVNFSIVGRNASTQERKEYVKWDKAQRERETIAYVVNHYYDDITATVGGETGIDIHPTGADKSQILKDFDSKDNIQFFGDAIFASGNDWSIAQAVDKRNYNDKAHHVKDWRDTWTKLRKFV